VYVFLSDDDAVTASDDVLTPATADQSTGKTYSVVLYSSNASCYLMLVAYMFVVIFWTIYMLYMEHLIISDC